MRQRPHQGYRLRGTKNRAPYWFRVLENLLSEQQAKIEVLRKQYLLKTMRP